MVQEKASKNNKGKEGLKEVPSTFVSKNIFDENKNIGCK
jgi:hypothetical protein